MSEPQKHAEWKKPETQKKHTLYDSSTWKGHEAKVDQQILHLLPLLAKDNVLSFH